MTIETLGIDIAKGQRGCGSSASAVALTIGLAEVSIKRPHRKHREEILLQIIAYVIDASTLPKPIDPFAIDALNYAVLVLLINMQPASLRYG